jgi:hypothetical protein
MCNLYSITTKPSRHHRPVPGRQPVCRQLAADGWCVSGLSRSGRAQHGRRPRVDHDALGHAAAVTGGFPVTNIRNTSSLH